jgi:hypothetical protein
MDFPIKAMLSWKNGTLAYTLIGLSYLIAPFIVSNALNYGLILFGCLFIAIGLIQARKKPSALGCFFAMLLGLCFFFGNYGTISIAALWGLSLLFFVLVLVFELDIIKFGPSSAKGKVLLTIPLGVLAFNYLLAFAAPYLNFHSPIMINYAVWMVVFNYLAVMLVCWIGVFNFAGYKLLGKSTNTWFNLLALVSVALVFLSAFQGAILGV